MTCKHTGRGLVENTGRSRHGSLSKPNYRHQPSRHNKMFWGSKWEAYETREDLQH